MRQIEKILVAIKLSRNFYSLEEIWVRKSAFQSSNF